MALASVTALAQTNAPTERLLSLDDCIATAVQHNFDVQIKRLNPDINRFVLWGQYGAYDPNFSLSGGHVYNKSPGTVNSSGQVTVAVESDDNTISGGFSGLLPWGLNYNLGGNFGDVYGPNGENAAGNIGFATLDQPLLKNLWIDSTRLQIILDKQNLKSSELDLRFQVMTTVTAVEQAYYNLIFAQQFVKVQEKALELAERLMAENKKRVEVGALAPLDEKQAESQAASSRADLLAAEAAEGTQQRVVKSLLSDDYSHWADVSIHPTILLVALPQKFNLQESWRNGLTLRPDLLEQKISLEKQGTVVRYQKNQLFPQLDVIGRYGYNASAVNVSEALGQFRGMENPSWSALGQLTVPLGRVSARNTYKAAKASKDQIALQLKQMEQNVLIQIENSIATAETDFQRVSATREARIYAEAALDGEQKKLEYGESTSFQVLQLQKDLTTARGNEIRALADYNIDLAQVALSDGTTLERRHVSVEVK